MGLWSVLRALLWIDPLIYASTILMGSLSLAASLVDGSGRRQQRIARRWARLVLGASGAAVTVLGRENLQAGASYVFCANHLSLIDTPLMFGYLDWDFRILARKGLFQVPFLGWHLRRAGHLPVARDNAHAAMRNLKEAARRVSQGVSILVFPEGGRSPDGALQEFRPGAAYIAIRAGVPIVPLAIVGTGAVHRMGTLVVRPGPVKLRIGEPVPASGLKTGDAGALTAQIRERIAALVRAAAG